MNLNVFYQSLDLMAKGMAGIFVVICVFYALIVILGKAFPEKQAK